MAEALPFDWGARLRQERDRRGWSRAELAAKINAGESSIYRWEEKGDKPHAHVLQALIDLFGKPVEGWGKSIWRVPYMHNAYFTGRERVLTYLHTRLGGPALSKPERLPVAVSQARAISGLGGIGKTQTAVEYAHRFEHEYDLVVLVHATSREVLVAELAGLAPLLGLPTYAETNQIRLAEAVKRWLETQKQRIWLLIFDNVEDIQLVKEFLPEKGNGAVLLTTRLQAVGKYIHKVELGTLTLEEGIQFFQTRLGAGEEPERKVLSESERQAAEQLYTLLGGLPLALEQAAAYIEEEACSLAEYVLLYQQQRATLLDRRSRIDQDDYPYSVATTWAISFRRVEQANPDAVALLRLCAFLHPDAIPEEALQTVVEDPQRLQEAIKLLLEYSLVQHHQAARMLTIHRLVQAVIQDGLKETDRRFWRTRAVLAVNAVFPQVEAETWPQCERLLTQALQVTQLIEQYQMMSEEAGRLLFETATYLQYRGRYGEAEPLYLHALHTREQQLGPEHPEVATTLNNLGGCYREQGKFAEAERLCQRALGIWEQQGAPEHAQVANVLNTLGILYTSRGKYAEAEPFYLRALAICEQQLGPRHHETARTLNILGNLYSFQGRYTEAEPLYLRSLDIWEQQLGPENSRLVYPLDGLAHLYHYQDRYTEAEPIYQRALSIEEQQLGPEHPHVAYLLTGWANLYHEQGRYGESEPLYRRALRIWEEQLGPEHPESAGTLSGLASLYARQGKYVEAEPLYRRALRIWEAQMGETHLLTTETLRALAELQEAQGHHEEARSGYARAWAARTQALGASSPPTPEARQHLLALLRAMGQYEEVARLKAAQSEQGTRAEAQARLPEEE